MCGKGDDLRKMSEDGHFFFECLYQIFTKGVKDYAEDTDRRANFVGENQHLLAGTMLVAMFSYLEATLGSSWINRCGGTQKRELECLRFVRNAFVHANCHIRDLDSYDAHLENQLRTFIDDLGKEEVTDDRGNTYPCYMELSADGVVRLNEHAINIFRALGRTISH